MYKIVRVYSGYSSNIRRTPVRLAATFLLISAVVLFSPHSDAEQNISAFQNIINKVSRSGSLLMLQAVCDRGKADFRDGIARCTACPSFNFSNC